MVSGAKLFPQTDRMWSPGHNEPNLRTVGDVTIELLRSGGCVNFVCPDIEGSEDANTSYQEFEQDVQRKLGNTQGLSRWQPSTDGLSFLNSVLQFIHFQMGESRTLLILRGLEPGQALADREPLTIAATSTELEAFETWLDSIRPAVEGADVTPKPLHLDSSSAVGKTSTSATAGG
jgi:hypothetical protein